MNQYQDAIEKLTPKSTSKFEAIWLESRKSISKNNLPDNEYVLYSAWEQLNKTTLMQKYFPKIIHINGAENISDMIVFHGGCLGCSSQYNYLIEVRCAKCMYFRADWSKEDLSI